MRQALGFLTPFGGARTPTSRTFAWFPAVGALLGGVLGAVWWGADRLWPRPVAAAIVVAADLAVTGMLHMDGLVDAADGLLPHLDRARRLEVMGTPDAGAFGICVAGAVLLLRWVALASLAPSALLLAGTWCVSRTSMAVVAMVVPYARAGSGGGLASAFLPEGGRGAPVAIGGFGLLLGGGLIVAWKAGPGAAVLAAAVVAVAAVTGLARRRVGGFTGDVLGAAGVVAETVGLVVAAARW